jgi:GH25 family lysozyme M1 (1,4-beta-N-acetylmuramidase)
MARQGIDVATFQGEIDWAKVKAAGIEFALLRCGYGSDDNAQDDARFEENVKGCEAAGLPWGAYLYSYALNLEEAESELQHILRLLKGKKPSYPVYLDMEDADGYKAKHGGIDNALCAAVCEHVCAGLTKAGYLAGVYANKDWLVNRLNDPKLAKYETWLAQWNDKPTYDGAFGIWQYTSDGSVDGITGRVDRNIAYKDYPAIMKEQGLNGWDKPAPAPAPSSPSWKAGDKVTYSGRLYWDSYGGNPGKTVSGTYTVDRVIDGRAYGVHIASGWLEAAKCKKASAPSKPAAPSKPVLKVGCKVHYSGRLYATSTGGNPGKTVDGTYTVSKILENKSHGILLNDGLGWVKESECEVVG